MSRDDLVSLVGIVLLLGAGLYALAWYWTPGFPDARPDPDAIARALGYEPVAEAQASTDTAVTPAQPVVVAAPATPTPEPQPTPTAIAGLHCPPGVQPTFVLGFADLKSMVGPDMGEPLECEHVNPENGDTLQQTTTGLAVYNPRTGLMSFTDGWRHWATTPQGLAYWEGDAVPEAVLASGAGQPAAGPSDTSMRVQPVAAGAPGEVMRVANTDGMGVAFRGAPSDDARLPQGIAEGQRVTVLERQGSDWARVRTENGREGWVPAQYLAPAQ